MANPHCTFPTTTTYHHTNLSRFSTIPTTNRIGRSTQIRSLTALVFSGCLNTDACPPNTWTTVQVCPQLLNYTIQVPLSLNMDRIPPWLLPLPQSPHPKNTKKNFHGIYRILIVITIFLTFKKYLPWQRNFWSSTVHSHQPPLLQRYQPGSQW